MGDIEKAKRELRFAKYSCDDKRWEQLEPKLAAIEAALEGVPDAEKAPVAAEVAAMKAKMVQGLREEKAGSISREIKRNLMAAAEDLNRGYKESPQLPKTIARLESAEAKAVLSPEAIAAFQAEIAALQAKSGGSPPPPPSKPQPAPTAAPSAAPAAKPASPPPAAENERAKAIENDVARTLRFVADDLGRNPLQVGSGISRARARLETDEAKQNLSPETMQRLLAQVDDLQTKYDAAVREDKARTLGDFIGRFIRNGEEDISHNRRGAEDMLRKASERILQADAKELLSAETVARFRSEIARVEKLVAEATKKDALERAQPLLEELEERVSKPIFDGSRAAWQVMGDLESLKTRVRGALHELSKEDADVKGIEQRIAAVDSKISSATAKLGRDEAHGRVEQSWEIERQAVAGWEEESSPAYELPKTATAVRRLTWFVNDQDLGAIGDAHKGDAPIQALLAEAKKTRDGALEKLHGAFNALLAQLEKGPRPSNRFDLERVGRLAGQAGSDFEGTPHKDANVARAKALSDRWDREIEAERKARQAKYDELSAQAAAAWPRILAAVPCEKQFDPQDSSVKGKAVLIKDLRNRIGWDFSGPYDFAIWVNGIPVIGNFDKPVAAAVNAACEKTGLPIDDHTDWDAVIVVGGPGKIKLRTEIIVRDRSNLEIGKLEEWRPVDAVTCTVIALRAGPCAAGPKG